MKSKQKPCPCTENVYAYFNCNCKKTYECGCDCHTKTKRYCIHPGVIISKNDRQHHMIDAPTLMRLYQIERAQCVLDIEVDHRKKHPYICLWPNYEGDYTLTPTRRGR